MGKYAEAVLILAKSQETQTHLLKTITEEITCIRKDNEVQISSLKKMSGKMFGFIFFLVCALMLALVNPALIPTMIPMVK